MFEIDRLWLEESIRSDLEGADLLALDTLAKRPFDWFEAPNIRRGGWSGVTRIVLNPEAPKEAQKAVFLKIQQNHHYIAPNTCFLKRLTFEREFAAMRALKPHCEAIPDVLMFAKWKENGNELAMLVTESLDDWLPLDRWLLDRHDAPAPDQASLHQALGSIARTAREINRAGWIHMCFSAKHLFLKRQDDETFATRVVDLEKTRKRIGLGRRTVKDCSHFLRHTPDLTDADKLCFLKAYFQSDHFTPSQKALIRRMRGAPKI